MDREYPPRGQGAGNLYIKYANSNCTGKDSQEREGRKIFTYNRGNKKGLKVFIGKRNKGSL